MDDISGIVGLASPENIAVIALLVVIILLFRHVTSLTDRIVDLTASVKELTGLLNLSLQRRSGRDRND